MSRLPAIVLLTAALLILGSCGDNSGVRPFADIQASDFTFEADPLDPSRTIFRVETTEPAICAIVWGETEALGNFNNSLDMNGTGIISHNVFLPGAVPGETYYFKVQGSTAEGSLYESELATFSVSGSGAPPVTGALRIVGENLALGATIADVSSEFSSSWAAANAIDGDMATEWSTAGDGGSAFIVIDLGESRTVAGVEFVTRSMADGSAVTTTYWVTVDDGPRFGPFSAGSPAAQAFHDLDTAGRLLRFEAEETTGGNTGAVEIRIFAPAG